MLAHLAHGSCAKPVDGAREEREREREERALYDPPRSVHFDPFDIRGENHISPRTTFILPDLYSPRAPECTPARVPRFASRVTKSERGNRFAIAIWHLVERGSHPPGVKRKNTAGFFNPASPGDRRRRRSGVSAFTGKPSRRLERHGGGCVVCTIENGSARIRGGRRSRGTSGSARSFSCSVIRSLPLARSLVAASRYTLRRAVPLRRAGRCASAYAPLAMVGRGGASHVTRPANRARA